MHKCLLPCGSFANRVFLSIVWLKTNCVSTDDCWRFSEIAFPIFHCLMRTIETCKWHRWWRKFSKVIFNCLLEMKKLMAKRWTRNYSFFSLSTTVGVVSGIAKHRKAQVVCVCARRRGKVNRWQVLFVMHMLCNQCTLVGMDVETRALGTTTRSHSTFDCRRTAYTI